MNLNDLLRGKKIDPQKVLVFRHRPQEPELRKVLPWLAAEKPKVFNAYQQTQSLKLERVMAAIVGSGFVASFIGHEPGKALFVGLYSITGAKPLTFEQYWSVPAYVEMKKYAMVGRTPKTEEAGRTQWFNLLQTDFYTAWKGKLIVGWPPPERSWWRRAHRNEIPVNAILEDSALVSTIPKWDKVGFTWQELDILPTVWKSALLQWRGIYFIFDVSDGKGYVGSAYGESNLLGRWLNYAASGHGGNLLLRKRNPKNFRFSILQTVSLDMDVAEIVKLETSWKQRLHTGAPHGLNDN